MGHRADHRPRALMLSKRANVFYLEHAKVIQQGHRTVFLTQEGGVVERFFNIPERNTAFLLLGKGTSITDAAVRRLAEANVLVGFCGSGGSPLFGALDLAFLPMQSEYRPTEYMQAWMRIWLDDTQRLAAARRLLLARRDLVANSWGQKSASFARRIEVPAALLENFGREIRGADTAETLLLAEARWAKALYGLLAADYRQPFVREPGGGHEASTFSATVNGFLDHGNYLAYGFAAVALHGLGVSFSLPLLHGKTRRGALVFDLADLIKDAYVMPMAFSAAARGDREQDFRAALMELCQEQQVLDLMFAFVSDLTTQATVP